MHHPARNRHLPSSPVPARPLQNPQPRQKRRTHNRQLIKPLVEIAPRALDLHNRSRKRLRRHRIIERAHIQPRLAPKQRVQQPRHLLMVAVQLQHEIRPDARDRRPGQPGYGQQFHAHAARLRFVCFEECVGPGRREQGAHDRVPSLFVAVGFVCFERGGVDILGGAQEARAVNAVAVAVACGCMAKGVVRDGFCAVRGRVDCGFEVGGDAAWGGCCFGQVADQRGDLHGDLEERSWVGSSGALDLVEFVDGAFSVALGEATVELRGGEFEGDGLSALAAFAGAGGARVCRGLGLSGWRCAR